VEEASTKTIEQSRDQIIDTLTDRKARNLAYDKAEQFYESVLKRMTWLKMLKFSILP
jgi:peptidyl-prolyl cis-trans isomerase D